MPFTFQDEYWEALNGLPVRDQTILSGALVRYYFTNEEPTNLSASNRGIFIMARQRVDGARKKAEQKAKERERKSCDSRATVATQSEDSLPTPFIYKEGEGDKEDLPNGKSKKAGAFTPPSVAQVAAYCQERGNKVDPSRFVDFYASKGWMVGKNRMKDWKAAVRTWEREEVEDERVDEPLPFKFAH